ncbi:hypothetical protein [Paraliomyxa miuraensis]|uniref:hypothetical protein n=1 Tax=Paraliomyxa miuraensis TaxID=376150 RepID=UPI002255BDB6|nr:hypothetical protein [Paraliomyxa miuraensis]MCX4239701.1 hypothetical protein [Paraliomyxa miuraensis]
MQHDVAILHGSLVLALGLVACGREPAPADAAPTAAASNPAPPASPPAAPAGEVVASTDPAPPSATPSETDPPPAAALDPAAEGTPAAADEAAVVPVSTTGDTLVVVGDGGIVELDLDGKVLRTLTSEPGRSPRWLPGKDAFVYLGQRRADARELRRFGAKDLVDLAIARLSLAAPCPKAAYAEGDEEESEFMGDGVPELDLTIEEELRVTADGKHVCMLATDHEADLRSNVVSMSIGLSTGKVERVLVFGGEECKRRTVDDPKPCRTPTSEDTEDEEDDASDLEASEPEEIESPFPMTRVHSRSPDERWLLIELASALGDVLHLQFGLYDTRTRKLYSLPRNGKVAWPKPTAVPSPLGEDETIPDWPDVGGGETIAWAGPHHLVLGRTLFVAGERIVELPGDIVR